MFKAHIEKGLACLSISFGVLRAFAGAFVMGIAFITSGQRAPCSAGAACLGSAVLLLIIAASLFREVSKTHRFIGAPTC